MRVLFLRRLLAWTRPRPLHVKVPVTPEELALVRSHSAGQSVSVESFFRACVFPDTAPVKVRDDATEQTLELRPGPGLANRPSNGRRR